MLSSKVKYFFGIILITVLSVFFIHATLTDDDKIQKEFETYYKIYSLATPDKLLFANEEVPVSDFDVHERYDREILTNVYWQSQTLLMIKRAHKFFPIVEEILRKNQIPDDMKYVVLAESGLQNLVSPANASGYWQFLEGTAKGYGLEVSSEVDERYHIEKSTEAACKYFNEAYKVFNSWALVAASYNMGIDGVRRQLQQQGVSNYYDLFLNTETSRYVFRILAIKQIVEKPQSYGFNVTASHKYTLAKTIKVRVNRSIPDLVKYGLDNATTYKDIKVLNPWLRNKKLTVDGSKVYYIELPKDKVKSNSWYPKVSNDTIDIDQTNLLN